MVSLFLCEMTFAIRAKSHEPFVIRIHLAKGWSYQYSQMRIRPPFGPDK